MIVYKIEYAGEHGECEVYYDELEWLMTWMQNEVESLDPGEDFGATITVLEMSEAEYDAIPDFDEGF